MYRGPEFPAHSPEGDIWSLGACIHVLCTGSPPFKKVPRGVDHREWYANPQARTVADITQFGYTKDLSRALYLTLRTDPNNRTTGRALVKGIDKLYDQWGGYKLPLMRGALKG